MTAEVYDLLRKVVFDLQARWNETRDWLKQGFVHLRQGYGGQEPR